MYFELYVITKFRVSNHPVKNSYEDHLVVDNKMNKNCGSLSSYVIAGAYGSNFRNAGQ
jgi:hypothetical protein